MRGGVKCESKVKYGLMFWGAGEKERKVYSENDGVLGNHVMLSPDFSDNGKWAGRDASVSLCELKQTLSFGLSLSHVFMISLPQSHKRLIPSVKKTKISFGKTSRKETGGASTLRSGSFSFKLVRGWKMVMKKIDYY